MNVKQTMLGTSRKLKGPCYSAPVRLCWQGPFLLHLFSPWPLSSVFALSSHFHGCHSSCGPQADQDHQVDYLCIVGIIFADRHGAIRQDNQQSAGSSHGTSNLMLSALSHRNRNYYFLFPVADSHVLRTFTA